MITLEEIEENLSSGILHIIPIGGKEPDHAATPMCWCHPLYDKTARAVHNARDCREAYERVNGDTRTPEEIWMRVYSDK